jgi:hypothetical protein
LGPPGRPATVQPKFRRARRCSRQGRAGETLGYHLWPDLHRSLERWGCRQGCTAAATGASRGGLKVGEGRVGAGRSATARALARPRGGFRVVVWCWARERGPLGQGVDWAPAGSHDSSRWSGLRGEVAGIPFYRRPTALVRRPDTPRAALTAGGGLPAGQRGSVYGASAGAARGRCRPRGASVRAGPQGRRPREGANLGKVCVGTRAVRTARTARRGARATSRRARSRSGVERCGLPLFD